MVRPEQPNCTFVNRGVTNMTPTQRSLRWPALAGLALLLSGCALPPAVTVVSFAADLASLGETGKTITDHGISLMAQKDCALMRVFSKTSICKDIPDENTPEGALVALAPLTDPTVAAAPEDPMTLPREFAYLDGSLGLAVARADDGLPAHAFADIGDVTAHGRTADAEPALLADARYLDAGMSPADPAATSTAAVH
jgi:hypothetical protein